MLKAKGQGGIYNYERHYFMPSTFTEDSCSLDQSLRSRSITVAISETLRSAAEQDALYAQGRTKPGNIVTNAKGSSYKSQHQWGIAFDFYLKMDVDGDGKISDDAYNDSKGHFKRAAEIGKKLGLAGEVTGPAL